MTDELDIYGHAEMCKLLGISRQRADQLRGNTVGRGADPDFPKPRGVSTTPSGRLACGPIWDGPELRAYAEATGRRPYSERLAAARSQAAKYR